MAKSLSTLLQEARYLIGDTGLTPVFSDAQLTTWINAAIADIGQHFPTIKQYDINCTSGTHWYDLDVTIMGIVSVEYPANQTPPHYIYRIPYTNPIFWNSTEYYDILQRHHADGSSYPPQIVISDSPTSSQVIRIEHLAERACLSSPTDVTDIMDRHTHLISLFVRWKAIQELSTTEAMAPDAYQHIISDSEINAKRAEEQYRRALQEAKASESETARVSQWRADKYDRVY